MTPRSIRRAAERKAAKLARKQILSTQNPKQGEGQRTPPVARRATGPRTPEGKAISCLNHTKHGLTGSFRVLATESQELFDELCDALRAEYAPITPTEVLLVDCLAEHTWLSQRAQRIADVALPEGNLQVLTLMLRYRTTHERAFHKCLAELRIVCREHARQPQAETRQFESQKPEAAAETGIDLDWLSPEKLQAYIENAWQNVNNSGAEEELRIAETADAA